MNPHNLQLYFYMILILFGSSIPGRAIPLSVTLFTWDKFLHVCEYFILGILASRAYSFKYNKIILSVLGIIFGCFDEIWQSFIPGRSSSYYDVIADGIGVICGIITFNFIKKNQND